MFHRLRCHIRNIKLGRVTIFCIIIGLNIVLADAVCEEQNCHERVMVEVVVKVKVDTGNHIAESVIFCSLNVVV
jgi:hypothetical protein